MHAFRILQEIYMLCLKSRAKKLLIDWYLVVGYSYFEYKTVSCRKMSSHNTVVFCFCFLSTRVCIEMHQIAHETHRFIKNLNDLGRDFPVSFRNNSLQLKIITTWAQNQTHKMVKKNANLTDNRKHAQMLGVCPFFKAKSGVK